MSHTPAPVAITNLMRTVGALSTTTQGFLAYAWGSRADAPDVAATFRLRSPAGRDADAA